MLVHKLLAPYNIQPVIAENGEEVFTLLEKQNFDLILMDVQMPFLDGITTTKLIRKYVSDKIPIVGMTAYVLPNEIEKCYAAGMNDHIPKPIDENQLFEVINKYIFLREIDTVHKPVSVKPGELDFTFLLKLCNGNETAMNTILDEMRKQLPVDFNGYKEAVENKDIDTTRKIIHHMKSTISPLGVESNIARAIIKTGKLLQEENNWNVIQEDSQHLLSVLEKTIDLIKKS